jgi:hypothetical protein
MASCVKSRILLRMLMDAWESCHQVKKLIAVKDGKERMALESELKHAFCIASRLSAMENKHVKTCLFCSTPSVQ